MSLQSDPPVVDAAMQPQATTATGDASSSFADQVRGQDMHAIDQTLARIMSDVYDGTGVEGWPSTMCCPGGPGNNPLDDSAQHADAAAPNTPRAALAH